MIEPKRLIEEGTAFDRTLLQAGREDRPPSDYARRVIAAVALMPTATAGAAVSTSILARLLRPRWLTMVALGAAATLLVATRLPAEGSREADAPARPVVTTAPEAPLEKREEPAAAHVAVPVTTPDALPNAPPPSAQPRERRAPVAAAQAPVANSEPAPISGASLQREVELLDAVKRSLRAGATADADRALADYDAEFPSGSLKPEAGFLHVRVLLAKGDRARAVALGDELLARYPNTVHAKRIRAALAADPAERK